MYTPNVHLFITLKCVAVIWQENVPVQYAPRSRDVQMTAQLKATKHCISTLM